VYSVVAWRAITTILVPMGLFGTSRTPGISKYELDKEHLREKLKSVAGKSGVFGYSTSAKRRRDAVDRMLDAHLDADYGGSGHHVIKRDEFEQGLEELKKDGVLKDEHVQEMLKHAEPHLRD